MQTGILEILFLFYLLEDFREMQQFLACKIRYGLHLMYSDQGVSVEIPSINELIQYYNIASSELVNERYRPDLAHLTLGT